MDATVLREAIDSQPANAGHRGRVHTPVSASPAGRGYSPQVEDHYRHPRNVGKLDSSDVDVGTGIAGAPDQGGVVRLQLRVDRSGNIEDTRFKAYGCGSTIAAASWASEWMKGKSLDQALSLRSTELVRALGLPPVKTHCAILAEDAIKAAVGDYMRKQE